MYGIYLCIHPVHHFPTWIDFRYRKTQFSSILMLRNHGLPRFDFSHFKKKIPRSIRSRKPKAKLEVSENSWGAQQRWGIGLYRWLNLSFEDCLPAGKLT